MEDVFAKLRVYCAILRFRLRFFCSKITMPFRLAVKSAKRYWTLRKIDMESSDRWERHLKIAELKRQDELELRRSQFFLDKVRLIGAFFRTSMYAECYQQMQELPNDAVNSREQFQINKEELLSAMQKLEGYEEFIFDENIKDGICTWEFEQYATQEELQEWLRSFAEYIGTLDIV